VTNELAVLMGVAAAAEQSREDIHETAPTNDMNTTVSQDRNLSRYQESSVSGKAAESAIILDLGGKAEDIGLVSAPSPD
jgi:hypothetical protein